MNKHTENAVIVSNVSKGFKIPLDKSSGLKQHIVNFFNRKRGYREFTALNDVSFEIKKGDFFGIVGRNGSGKSTLLKIIAQIYNADSGGVVVNGSLVPFIELGVGFNPELTGRENVFLNGALLGFSKQQMEAMYEEIVDFAELHDFMEEKLKNYSSGMQVRLAFSIAIRSESDILLLDEVLAVGDEAFQRKCEKFFQEIKKDKSKTVILVTHGMEQVKEYCDKALLIDEGVVKTISADVGRVADSYSRLFISKTNTSNNQEKRFGSGEVVIENIRHNVTNEKITVALDIIGKTDQTYEKLYIGVNVKHNNNIVLGNHMKFINGYQQGFSIVGKEKKHFVLELENILTKHAYTLDFSVRNGGGILNFDTINDAVSIPMARSSSSTFYKALIPTTMREKGRK